MAASFAAYGELTEKDDFEDEFADEEAENTTEVFDPLQPFNRLMFHVNDKLYFWILKPAAQGYKRVVPEKGRSGLRNFFTNLATPVRLASALLQLRGDEALEEFSVNAE